VAEFTIEERRRKSAELKRLMSRGAGKRPDSLTAREIEVLGWAARGKSAREIAEILQITKRTVDAHVHSAIGKIDAVNRNNAVAIAIRDRLIDVWRPASPARCSRAEVSTFGTRAGAPDCCSEGKRRLGVH